MYENKSLIKLPVVISVTGKSRSSIYDDIKSGRFPKPLKIGKRSVAWKYSDIELWINSLESSQRGANHE